MNRINRLIIIVVLLLTSCTGQPAQTVVVQPEGQPAYAAVTAVEILRLLNDPQDIRVAVSGTLANQCAQLQAPQIEREGRLFSITLPVRYAGSGPCLPEPVSFERVVRLQVAENAGPVEGRFGVLVNGTLQNFDIITPLIESQVAVTGVDLQPTPAAALGTDPVVVSGRDNQPITFNPPPVADPVNLGPAIGPASCINKAAFFEDVTIPPGASMDPGTKFVKTWKVRNEGTCIWGAGYQLRLVDGDALGSEPTVALTEETSPLEVVQISVSMTAPAIPGSYHSDWGFSTPDGQIFGVGSAGLYPLSFKVGVRQTAPSEVGCEAEFSTDYELVVLEQINAERAQRNLPPHVLDAELSNVARAHSLERGCIGVHSHAGADGKNYETRVKRAGIAYQFINEIIYNGNYGPKPPVQWWVYESQLHHDIVMAKKYSTVGVGYAKTKRGQNKEYFTVLFMKP